MPWDEVVSRHVPETLARLFLSPIYSYRDVWQGIPRGEVQCTEATIVSSLCHCAR
jgi:hypothetical protein